MNDKFKMTQTMEIYDETAGSIVGKRKKMLYTSIL